MNSVLPKYQLSSSTVIEYYHSTRQIFVDFNQCEYTYDIYIGENVHSLKSQDLIFATDIIIYNNISYAIVYKVFKLDD
jgi:hypothetical protein